MKLIYGLAAAAVFVLILTVLQFGDHGNETLAQRTERECRRSYGADADAVQRCQFEMLARKGVEDAQAKRDDVYGRVR